jgi:hypothetical protein
VPGVRGKHKAPLGPNAVRPYQRRTPKGGTRLGTRKQVCVSAFPSLPACAIMLSTQRAATVSAVLAAGALLTSPNDDAADTSPLAIACTSMSRVITLTTFLIIRLTVIWASWEFGSGKRTTTWPLLMAGKDSSVKCLVPALISRSFCAVDNNQFLKDIFQACMMHDVLHLAIAVRNIYRNSDDFAKVESYLETLYVSGRLQLPLKGILLIGY